MVKCYNCNKILGFFEKKHDYEDSEGNLIKYCSECDKKFEEEKKKERLLKRKKKKSNNHKITVEYPICKEKELPFGMDKMVNSLMKQLEKEMDGQMPKDGMPRGFNIKIQTGNPMMNKDNLKYSLVINGATESSLVKDAKEIIISPKRVGMDIEMLYKKNLNKDLIGRLVCIGADLYYTSDPKVEEDGFGDFFNSGFLNGPKKLNVIKTSPKGTVKVTEKTLIKIVKRSPDESDIPKDKLISVSKLENVKDMINVKNIAQIIKIANAGLLINKYENKTKIVYSSNGYYLEVLKNEK